MYPCGNMGTQVSRAPRCQQASQTARARHGPTKSSCRSLVAAARSCLSLVTLPSAMLLRRTQASGPGGADARACASAGAPELHRRFRGLADAEVRRRTLRVRRGSLRIALVPGPVARASPPARLAATRRQHSSSRHSRTAPLGAGRRAPQAPRPHPRLHRDLRVPGAIATIVRSVAAHAARTGRRRGTGAGPRSARRDPPCPGRCALRRDCLGSVRAGTACLVRPCEPPLSSPCRHVHCATAAPGPEE